MTHILDRFSIACFCKEGGAPHESNTGTCKHIEEERVLPRTVLDTDVGDKEVLVCSACEDETAEDVEECPECSESFHPSCMEDHGCEVQG